MRKTNREFDEMDGVGRFGGFDDMDHLSDPAFLAYSDNLDELEALDDGADAYAPYDTYDTYDAFGTSRNHQAAPGDSNRHGATGRANGANGHGRANGDGDRGGVDLDALGWGLYVSNVSGRSAPDDARDDALADELADGQDELLASRNGARPQQRTQPAHQRRQPPAQRASHSQRSVVGSVAGSARATLPQGRLNRSSRVWRSYRVASLLLRTLYIINRERTRVTRARERGDTTVRPDMQALLRVLREFRKTAVELGGLLIKLGQFLGTRADLLPPEALAELAALQDDVAPEPFPAIRAEIERELTAPLDELFAEFIQQPEGAASLGQVHKARLHDGRLVAVKVQRPGIVEIVQADLSVLRFVLEIVRRMAPAVDRIVDLRALYREFSRTVYEELDYQHEGRNAERFAANFGDDPLIAVPEVIWPYSTRRVLTLEWMEGIKITQVGALEAAGVDREALARRLASSYFRQTLETGFFHADPHPGNIFVQPLIPGKILRAYKQPAETKKRNGQQAQPEEVFVRVEPGMARIVFLDFGMMGEVTPQMRGGLRDCLTGAVQRDAARFTRGLDALGFLSPDVDRAAIERVIAAMIAQFAGRPVGQMGQVDPNEALGDVRETLYEQPFRLPAEFAFFGRMVGILFGLTASLSPNINFIEVATPYAQQFLRRGGIGGLLSLLGIENESLGALGLETLREGIAVARSVVDLPRRLDHVLTQVEHGDLRVGVVPTLADDVMDRRVRGGRNGRNGRNGGRRSSRRTRAVSNLLSYPTPAWLTMGLAGASVLTMVLILRRRDSSIKWSELFTTLRSRGPRSVLKNLSDSNAGTQD